ncbi:NADAR family protein [Pseudomonas sp.]|uniref:NADAR family protein n=1 Tax=Pseudomonas sp. TaxID=306 RepID=UPI0028A143E9|nr:NADAR family protein [Pseudomonas sp.]
MRKVANLTLFFSENDPFSNWYRSEFKVKEISFVCVEQFMMFCKAKLFKDDAAAERILAAEHPRAHKNLGRSVSGYNDAIWNSRRLSIVTHGCYAKFTQNEDLLQALLETGETMLVEASPYDRVWGVGLGENDPRIEDPRNWKGTNLLGQALFKTRERIKAELSAQAYLHTCDHDEATQIRPLKMG